MPWADFLSRTSRKLSSECRADHEDDCAVRIAIGGCSPWAIWMSSIDPRQYDIRRYHVTRLSMSSSSNWNSTQVPNLSSRARTGSHKYTRNLLGDLSECLLMFLKWEFVIFCVTALNIFYRKASPAWLGHFRSIFSTNLLVMKYSIHFDKAIWDVWRRGMRRQMAPSSDRSRLKSRFRSQIYESNSNKLSSRWLFRLGAVRLRAVADVPSFCTRHAI